MTFEFITTPIQSNFLKVNIKESNIAVSFDEVLGMLENDDNFRLQFTEFLKSIKYSAFNIEWKPITVDDVSQPFEMVIVECSKLNEFKADSSSFDEYFNNSELTAVFENLGGDAVLISPYPSNDKDFTHLRPFLDSASKEQITDLFIAVGEIAAANLGREPIYVNTSGLGVRWLHVRIDDEPKYYQYEQYKKN